jgi:WD40 repeat protein
MAKRWRPAVKIGPPGFAPGLAAGGVYPQPQWRVYRLAFSPDGRTLAMSGPGGAGRVIRLVDVETGSPKAELRGHLKDISSLAFTQNGQTLLSASDDGTIRVWDPVPRVKEDSVHVFDRNSISTDWRSYVPALCLSPDGRHLLAVYTNQTFSVWDTLRLAEGTSPSPTRRWQPWHWAAGWPPSPVNAAMMLWTRDGLRPASPDTARIKFT